MYQSSSTITLFINIDGVATNADIVDGVHQVFLTITRLSDNTAIVTNSGVDNQSEGHYAYILDPNDNLTLGKYKVAWRYTVNGEVFPKTQYYDVVVPYTSALDFRADMQAQGLSVLSEKSDGDIYRKEKLARHIINTFCKQSFDFEVNITKKIEGGNAQTLILPKRIYSLDSVLVSNSEDISDDLEIYTDFHLRRKEITSEFDEKSNLFGFNFFRKHVYYYVTGSWGWEAVPQDIQSATNLLIADYFQDDSLLRQHGIYQTTMGDEQYYFNNDLWNTTGNYDVDMLISNFTIFDIRIF